MIDGNRRIDPVQEWGSRLAIWTTGYLLFETLTGLSIWLLPFSIPNQVMVLVHTSLGLLFLLPCSWYVVRHWLLYRRHLLTHIKLTGYLGVLVLAACGVSGVVLSVQALTATRISYTWDTIHIVTTLAVIAFVVPHVLLIILRNRRAQALQQNLRSVLAAAGRYAQGSAAIAVILLGVVALASYSYEPPRMKTQFDPDYSFKYGEGRPFAPSLARTETNGPYDARLLSGSKSCGTAGCHEQIYQEWQVSAHRYAAMDVGFQVIQLTMAKQNGPESTRYCGGCHDPISLFSGTKNIFTDAEKLSALEGYQEGVSCVSCHSVRETDLKGNAHYVIARPEPYLFELEYNDSQSEILRVARDFLIRAYPQHHLDSLSKKLFKAPEYCAACHKQFIDKDINNVGWVQLQNQYDNWRKSRWNHPKDPTKTIECRECHMPLVDSRDPSAGDPLDYNRSAHDRKHRSHRFVAANQMMPKLLNLPGWQEQLKLTEKWLQGKFPIPEIEEKWVKGPTVALQLLAPQEVGEGERVDIRAIITSNKVGHDFPTGPLDIIQAWVELVVKDGRGREVFVSGRVDDKGFIQPGSFMFKAEPVDQYGNLIDRHNLWEMVGVRHRRALFPGFSDTADYNFLCPDLSPLAPPYTFEELQRSGMVTVNRLLSEAKQEKSFALRVPNGPDILRVRAKLNYRKIDQYLLNFVLGKDNRLSSPVTEMASDQGVIRVVNRD